MPLLSHENTHTGGEVIGDAFEIGELVDRSVVNRPRAVPPLPSGHSAYELPTQINH